MGKKFWYFFIIEQCHPIWKSSTSAKQWVRSLQSIITLNKWIFTPFHLVRQKWTQTVDVHFTEILHPVWTSTIDEHLLTDYNVNGWRINKNLGSYFLPHQAASKHCKQHVLHHITSLRTDLAAAPTCLRGRASTTSRCIWDSVTNFDSVGLQKLGKLLTLYIVKVVAGEEAVIFMVRALLAC